METIRFEDLELDAKIMRAITDMGFEAASPIQGQAIPLELQGLDIIGQAQTGTGKTAAFGIPLLQKIDPKNKKPQAIILCPTRELAIQVSEEIRRRQNTCTVSRFCRSTADRRSDVRSVPSRMVCRLSSVRRACDGSHAPQNRQDGSDPHGCS